MAGEEIPDLLTVPEAALILRMGRTAAYEQARRWRDTNGREGLPCIEVGGSLRVPLALLERHFSIRVTHIPGPDARRRSRQAKRSEPVRDLEVARSEPAERRPRRSGRQSQAGLPFAG